MPAERPPSRLDPVTLEVVRHSLVAMMDEIDTNLTRTAFSPLIYEYKDYTVGLVDRAGRLIAQSNSCLPIFAADLGTPVLDCVQIWGEENLHDDDILLNNYADVCGQHLNNVVMFTPLRVDGQVVAHVCARAHWSDVGGRDVGSSTSNSTTEIYQEGIQLRALKLHKRGVPDPEIERIIRHNTRLPIQVMGDIEAQLAAVLLGKRRFLALVARYGWPTVETCIEEIWRQSEQRARAAVAAMPDGEYFAESHLDNDGVVLDQPVRIAVRLLVQDDQVTMDLSGFNPVTKGPINSGREGGGMTAARVAFKTIVAPHEPANDGMFRPLRIELPLGTFMSAREPAPMARWSIPMPTVIDTMLRAFSGAVPDRVPAAHHGNLGSFAFFGHNPRTGRLYFNLDTNLGGWGGRPHEDGFGPLKAYMHGDTRDIPIEVVEAFYPLRVESYEYIPDSGGAGRFRGTPGLRKVYTTLADASLTTNFDRQICPPWGLWGGQPGATSRAVIHRPTEPEPFEVRKVNALPLPSGSTVTIESGSGGGWGNPFERDPWRVQADVEQGYLSLESARRVYGVVLDPATLEVDAAATKALREQAAATR